MMIKQIFENAINQIEQDKARNAEVARQNALREQVAPFNAEIDAKLRDALAELQERHNQNVAQLQRAFEQETREMNEAAARKKQEFFEATMASALAAINAEAETAIKKLKEFIGDEG